MTNTINLAPSLTTRKPLPNNTSKVLTLLWAIKIGKFNEYDQEIIDVKTVNADWFNLIGDYVEWSEDLYAQIYTVNIDSECNPSHNRILNNKVSKNTEAVFQSFINVLAREPVEVNFYLQVTAYNLVQHWVKIRAQDSVWQNINLLCGLFNLNNVECKILLYAMHFNSNRELRKLFREIESISTQRTRELFAIMLDCSQEQFNNAIHQKSTLMVNRIISSQYYLDEWYNSFELSLSFVNALTFANKDIGELMSHFIDKISPSNLEIADIPHLQDSLYMLSNVVRTALQDQEKGINILIYGPPGTGKTEFAKLLSQQINTTMYEVSARDSDGESAGGRERYLSLLMAQNYLTGKSDTILLFDEVEDVLIGSGLGKNSHQVVSNRMPTAFSKAWVNQQLENNPVPTIWICNEHEFIDPAHIRRFIFHIEFKIPPRAVRQKILERYLKPFNLSGTILSKLSYESQLSPAQLKNTARLLHLNNSTNPKEIENLLEKSIRNSMSAMGKTLRTKAKLSITSYNLDYLNIDSHVPIVRILDGMKIRPQASMCFYGPPGTGKTQLAEYIAEQLDKNLIVKRASDLISPWLGQSEQNIAAMFKDAQNEEAILFLDEADSFLRSRQGMTKSWEVSQVNELLQQIEVFEGIFICATNLFNQLDEAVLRRFVFKIRFDFLLPEQRSNLFAKSLCADSVDISHEDRHRLLKLEQLTPGDFATVLRQADTLGETFSAHELLNQLEKECELKRGDKSPNKIGFI
jgi:SpoVK/Ycf46/Vps4 family AAA+-type ATPase